jgi:ABC-type phosphate/phosphonate transport system permease subunit
MRPGDLASGIARPALSGSMRARQTKKEQERVTVKQWLGFVAVAAFTTWLTKQLDDVVERRLA